VHRPSLLGFPRPPWILQQHATGAAFHLSVERTVHLLGPTRVDFALHGPGVADVRLVDPVRVLLRFLPTPIDEDELEFLVLVYAAPSRVPLVSSLRAWFFRSSVAREISEHAPIWELNALRERPLLSEGDGPIVALRTWFQRFYDQPSTNAPLLVVSEH
jgi:3-Ketosteroid 9alpha-hydroxylase C-terminal domain